MAVRVHSLVNVFVRMALPRRMRRCSGVMILSGCGRRISAEDRLQVTHSALAVRVTSVLV